MKEALARVLASALGYELDPWPADVYRTLRAWAAKTDSTEHGLVARLELGREPELLIELLTAATIPHTAFFRHQEHFDYLTQVALPTLRDRVGRPIKIWSAGCATGEEPYSIAMCAQVAGVEVSIVATDVSEGALAIAVQGHYGAARTRGLPGWHPERGWQASSELRGMIRFHRASVTGSKPTGCDSLFDIIFCRNVLIYFGHDQAPQALDRMFSRLHGHGSLVVAPVEGVLRLGRIQPPKAPLGWFSARARVTLFPRRLQPAQQPARPAPALSPLPPASKPDASTESSGSSSGGDTSSVSTPLEHAAQALGLGALDDAEQRLRALLDTDPEQGEAWFLLGEVLSQRGEQAQARVAFLRASTASVFGPDVDGRTLTSAARRRAELLERPQAENFLPSRARRRGD